MDLVALAALVAAVIALLAAFGVLVWAVVSMRRRQQRELAAARADVSALQARLDSLSGRLDRPQRDDDPGAQYVITDLAVDTAGAGTPVEAEGAPSQVSGGAFASLVAGEVLVRTVALGHGVRRALSPENRNRIGFEMRRELKRSRKDRRRELKEARRHLRARSSEAVAQHDGKDAA